jgi:predicted secreted protein
MAKFAAKGTTLAYQSGSTYLPILQLDSIEYGVGDTDEVEVTAYESANSNREYLPTWKSTSPMTFSGFYDPGITSHAYLRGAHGGAAVNWRITLTDTGAAVEAFSAYVKDFSVQPDLNGALKFSFSLRPVGAVTITP